MAQARPVQRAMRILSLVVALFALGALIGCSGRDKTAGSTPAKREPTEAERLEKLKKAVEETTDGVPDKVYDISEPGTKGWKATTESMSDLGDRIDERMADAQDVLVKAMLTFDDPASGKMVYKPEIRIADAKTFDVRYSLPENKGSQVWVRADGTRRAQNVDATWTYLKPFGSSAPAMSTADVVEFPKQFPSMMFSKYTEGRDVWGSLFDAWKRGVGGYKATIEEQSFTVGGKTRKAFRVLARTKGDGGAEVEVVIDAEALRPMTVRSVGTNEDGSEYKIMWTGQWMVGGKFKRSSFKLPKVLPDPPAAT